MDDAVARYRSASERNDMPGLLATLAPDAELVSPISGMLVFCGARDVQTVLAAAYACMSGLRWHEQIDDGDACVLIGSAWVAHVRMSDAMVLELDAEGRIRRIRPHLRPWLALTLLALKIVPRMALHPRVMLRAVRRA